MHKEYEEKKKKVKKKDSIMRNERIRVNVICHSLQRAISLIRVRIQAESESVAYIY